MALLHLTEPPVAVTLDELTPTELRVLELLADGWSNPGIAERMVLSLRTVEWYVGQVFLKLGLSEERRHCRRVRAAVWLREARAPAVARAA